MAIVIEFTFHVMFNGPRFLFFLCVSGWGHWKGGLGCLGGDKRFEDLSGFFIYSYFFFLFLLFFSFFCQAAQYMTGSWRELVWWWWGEGSVGQVVFGGGSEHSVTFMGGGVCDDIGTLGGAAFPGAAAAVQVQRHLL